MGQIGRFIDHCCEHHPQLMRAVLERPLAPLGSWLTWDDSSNLCGCLIGTAALAGGFEARGKAQPHRTPLNDGEAVCFVADLVEWSSVDICNIGMGVFYLSERLSGERDTMGPVNTPESDARTVHLLRQRIARQLAIRESAMGDVGALPNEPLEPSPSHCLGGGAGR